MTDPPEEAPPPIVQTVRVTPPEAAEAEDDDYDLWDAGEQVKKLAARFANRMYVIPEGQNVRISFGEVIKGENIYFASFVVPNGEALEMGHLLTRMAQASVDAQVRHLRDLADALERVSQAPDERSVG